MGTLDSALTLTAGSMTKEANKTAATMNTQRLVLPFIINLDTFFYKRVLIEVARGALRLK